MFDKFLCVSVYDLRFSTCIYFHYCISNEILPCPVKIRLAKHLYLPNRLSQDVWQLQIYPKRPRKIQSKNAFNGRRNRTFFLSEKRFLLFDLDMAEYNPFESMINVSLLSLSMKCVQHRKHIMQKIFSMTNDYEQHFMMVRIQCLKHFLNLLFH